MRYTFAFTVGFVFVWVVLSSGCIENQGSRRSVDGLLKAYGFETREQKKAIEDLFKKASILSEGQTLNQAFPTRHTDQAFLADVLDLVEKTQRQFVIRSGTQDRWEVKPHQWMSEDKNQILHDLDVLGFIKEVNPAQTTTDVLCILGSTGPVMAERLEYANKLMDAGFVPKNILLLTGERYVAKGIDGSEQELTQIAKTYHLQGWNKVTEAHVFKELYEKSSLKKKNLLAHVVDTPRGDLPRPTTQTTLLELMKWLKDHPDVHTVVFVSNQPYVAYQGAVIQAVLDSQGYKLSYQVIGRQMIPSLETQGPLEGLGSYLWAAVPSILTKIGIESSSVDLKKRLKDLYGKNALIFGALPEKLRS